MIFRRCGSSPARSSWPRLVKVRPRAPRTKSATSTVVVSRRSAALTADCVRQVELAGRLGHAPALGDDGEDAQQVEVEVEVATMNGGRAE